VIPNIESAFETAILAQARMRAAAAAVAIERYRRKHGRLPATLDDLAPEFLSAVPADPFDGKPVRFVVRDGEYTVYSISKDGQDNGGQEMETTGEPDVTFTVPRRSEE
jgi:type II secretory pathway pseudopilin PulG